MHSQSYPPVIYPVCCWRATASESAIDAGAGAIAVQGLLQLIHESSCSATPWPVGARYGFEAPDELSGSVRWLAVSPSSTFGLNWLQ